MYSADAKWNFFSLTQAMTDQCQITINNGVITVVNRNWILHFNIRIGTPRGGFLLGAIINPIGNHQEVLPKPLKTMKRKEFHNLFHQNNDTLNKTANNLGYKLTHKYKDCIGCGKAKAKSLKIKF